MNGHKSTSEIRGLVSALQATRRRPPSATFGDRLLVPTTPAVTDEIKGMVAYLNLEGYPRKKGISSIQRAPHELEDK